MSFERDFFEKYAPLVQAEPSPLEPSIRLAQMALESDWGRSELATKANNFGGIKASPPFNGEVYAKKTLEWDSNKQGYVEIVAEFAKFKTVEEFMKYKANFLTRNEYAKKTYAKVLSATTVLDKTKALTGTYATDPKYSDKLMNIINKYNLTQYDKVETKTSTSSVTKTETKQVEVKEVVNSMELYPFKQKITQVNIGGWINKADVKYLVFHFVGASGQALANANYFYNVDRSSSAHLFIDSKEIYQVVPFNRVAWHVGKRLFNYSRH